MRLIVVLVVLVAVTCLQPASRDLSTIPNSDSFADVLSKLKTSTFYSSLPSNIMLQNSYPNRNIFQKSIPVCSAVWSREATNCAGDKLAEFQRAQSSEVNTKINSLKTKFDSAKLSLAVASWTATRSLGLVSSGLVNPLAIILSPFFTSIELAAFQTSMSNYWEYLKNARGTALCYICAKDSSLYIKSNKTIISEKDCADMTKIAYPFFSLLFKLIDGVSMSTSDWAAKNPGVKKIFTKLKDAIEEVQVEAIVDAYREAKTVGDKQLYANHFCVRMFRLRKDPLFGLLEELITRLSSPQTSSSRSLYMSQANDKDKSNNGQGEGQDKKDDSQYDGTDDNYDLTHLFVGDITISQPGGFNFVDYSQSFGTIQYSDPTAFKCMNLSMKFL